MTQHKVWLGSTGPYYFDDTQDLLTPGAIPAGTDEAALTTTGQLFVQEAPSVDENVVRLVDLTGSLSNATPLEVETVPSAGVGTKSSREDHVHGGVNLGDAQTITGLKTFNLGANAPFAVDAASLKVTNLDADKLDGRSEAEFAAVGDVETITGLWTFNRGAAVPFAVDAASLKVTNLDADKLDGRSEAEFAGIADTETIAGAWTFTTNPIITNAAPGLVFTDTTGSAKSLTIAVDANAAELRESAGAAGSLLTLDLANSRVGIGGTPTNVLHVLSTANVALTAQVQASDASGTTARAIVQALASTATVLMTAHGAGRVATRYGITVGSYAEILSSAGNGLLIGTNIATPVVIGTNDVERLRVSATGVQVAGNFAVNGQTPAAQQTYTVSNVTTDRSYDANATTLDEVADALGTLIADLRAIGLLL